MPLNARQLKKAILERLLNTRFDGNAGNISIEANPNIWNSDQLYPSTEIPGGAAARTGTYNAGQNRFTVPGAKWRTNQYVGRFLKQDHGGGSFEYYPIAANGRTLVSNNPNVYEHYLDLTVGNMQPAPIDTDAWWIICDPSVNPAQYQTAGEKHRNWLSEGQGSIQDTDENNYTAFNEDEGERNSTVAGNPKDHPGGQLPAARARRVGKRIREGNEALDGFSLDLFNGDRTREVMNKRMAVFDKQAQLEAMFAYLDWIRAAYPGEFNNRRARVYEWIDNQLDLDVPDNHTYY